jgi:DNA-binding NtrC family response regulator
MAQFAAAGHDLYVTGISPKMLPVQKLISEIAPTDIPVMLLGESGTGKEMVALHIHGLSQHSDLPFVKFNCAALTPEMLEDRLMSGENGHLNQNGNAATATGTVFFDEIAELDSTCQRYLMHAIRDGNRFTGHQSLAGRVISCTTRDIEKEVQSGKFRSELFYRVNGVCLQLPPLRRRREDIPLLITHFLGKYARIFQRAEMTLSEQALQLLVEHPWPGNIRELENVIKRIVALENEELGIADVKIAPLIPPVPQAATTSRSLKAASRAASRQAERELILQTLERTHWNRKRAAEALQISYKSLLFKLKQIQVPESEEAQKIGE